jgi:Lipocalin-like domain
MATRNLSDARKRFVGVWTLESFTERSDGAEESAPLGEEPQGFLIYTTDGFVSAQLMRAKREPLMTDPWEVDASGGGVVLTKDYIAYCGRYEVDEVNSEVIHVPLVALLPNLIHQEQHRSFIFEDETLTLVTTRRRPNGSVVASTLLWRRSPLEVVG